MNSNEPKREETNPFLSKVSLKLLKSFLLQEAPPQSEDYLIRESIENGEKLIEVWFRTRGCHHFLRGGCTMCNYGLGNTISEEQMINSVDKALKATNLNNRNNLIVSPSGSMLDDWEVPENVRIKIMELINHYSWASFAFETRAEFVTDNRINQVRNVIGNRTLKVVVALETANPWVLKYSINKNLDLDVYLQAVSIAKNYGGLVASNVIIGAPFLTEKESIDEAVKTVNWCFENNVDECCLFPVHVKQGTLVHWLWRNGLYHSPSLWSLVEVLKRLDPILYPKIGIAWHKTYYDNVESVETLYKYAPHTCPRCQDEVIKLLDKYLAFREPSTICDLDHWECDCKNEWLNRVRSQPSLSVKDRAIQSYEKLGIELMGQEWWTSNGAAIIDQVCTFNSAIQTKVEL